MRAGLVIPTRNAGIQFERLLAQIGRQTCPLAEKLVIDSSSDDGTAELAKHYGFSVTVIPKADFRHGRTRQQAFFQLKDGIEYILFLTQDVLLHDDHSLELLLEALADKTVGAAYGRQLPHEGASLSAAIHRQFNYPAKTKIKYFKDRLELGIKTPFLSNSFAAYRCSALNEIGGFPAEIDICEDIYVGAKLLMAGYGIAYAADAQVYHSHEFSVGEIFQRYSAIGDFYRKERWITELFGTSQKEGCKFFNYQMKKAWHDGRLLSIPRLMVDDVLKFMAYHSEGNVLTRLLRM